jgi:phosphoserine phosphatase
LVDAEQVVVAGRLVLALSVDNDAGADLAAVLSGAGLGDLDVEVTDAAGAPQPTGGTRHHVTVLGPAVEAADLAAVSAAVASCGANIERIERLADYPVIAYGLLVAGGEPGALRAAMSRAARGTIDVAVERAGLARRAKRLLVLDVDSTLIQGEVIDLLADRAGTGPHVAAVTAAAMAGELDFEASLRARVALLAGLPDSVLRQVAAGLTLARGARTLVRTVRRLGYRVGVVSGGFSQVVDPLAASLGLDHAVANTLEVSDGVLTGGLVGPVIDRAGKAAALSRFAEADGIPLAQTVAVGDGANDVEMLALAGLGIAYNATPVVTQAADASLTVPYLDAVLFLLGLTRAEIEDT